MPKTCSLGAVVALAAVGLIPAAASAQQTIAPELRVHYQAVADTWRTSPCYGHEIVEASYGPPQPGAAGMWYPGTCRVAVDVLHEPETICMALMHELGHAAGHGHSDDPRSVMHHGGPEPSAWPQACLRGPLDLDVAYAETRRLATKRQIGCYHRAVYEVICRATRSRRPDVLYRLRTLKWTGLEIQRRVTTSRGRRWVGIADRYYRPPAAG